MLLYAVHNQITKSIVNEFWRAVPYYTFHLMQLPLSILSDLLMYDVHICMYFHNIDFKGILAMIFT